MKHTDRRKALGEMFIDVAKYLLTIVAVGALVAEKIDIKMMLMGIVGAVIFGLLGFWTIPLDKET